MVECLNRSSDGHSSIMWWIVCVPMLQSGHVSDVSGCSLFKGSLLRETPADGKSSSCSICWFDLHSKIAKKKSAVSGTKLGKNASVVREVDASPAQLMDPP